MEVSGKTPEDLLVLNGVGTLCFTNGVPLELILSFFKRDGYVVDWVDYIKTALLDGHNPRTIRSRIDSAVSDVYGRKYADEVLVRTDRVIHLLVG